MEDVMAMIYLLLGLWLVVRLEDCAVQKCQFWFSLRERSHELIGQPITCQSMACSLVDITF